jgi:hypothetical protein
MRRLRPLHRSAQAHHPQPWPPVQAITSKAFSNGRSYKNLLKQNIKYSTGAHSPRAVEQRHACMLPCR